MGTHEPDHAGTPAPNPDADFTSLPGRPPTDIHKRSTTISPAGPFPVRLGHFQVRRVIAAGPTGTIYEAEQDHPRRLVTLKLLGPGPVSDAARRRFDEEAQILAGLRHPAIAQIYEAGTLDLHATGGPRDTPYIAMEYVPATRTLLDHARARNLSLAQRLELFGALCDAVQHGHQRGVAHRGIRPANILIDADGKPKIIDFGFTRTLTPEQAGEGTPADDAESAEVLIYTSPELLRRDPTQPDTRSDVYSLGVLLYELVTDRLPYDPEEIASRGPGPTLAADPRRPSTLTPTLRGDAETIILKAMHRDPARRYRSAGDLDADVRRYLDSRPISARRDSAAYVLRTMVAAGVARHPIPGTILAVALAWLLANWPGVPLVFTWTPLGLWFERGAERFAPASTHPPLSQVRLIAITDDTNLEALAAEAGITGVSNSQPRSYRALHGRLMERLAESRAPRVVTWDLYFPSAHPADETFARGVGAARAAGIPVVVGIFPWSLDSAEEPGIAPAILASGVRWGGATIDEGTPWKLDAIAWRGDAEPQPSLVLESLVASDHPEAEAVYRVDEERGQVEVRYRAMRPGSTRRREVDRARVAIGAIGGVDEKRQGHGLRPGDGCGALVLQIPDNEALREATIPYERAFRAGPDELRSWLEGKAVVLANLRDREDYSRYGDGRTIARPYAHLVALDTLLGGPIIRLPRPAHITWLVLGGALMGALVPWRVRGVASRVTVVLTIGALMLAASLLAFGYAHYLCNPLIPVLSLVVAATATAWVVRARDSRALRRVPDRT